MEEERANTSCQHQDQCTISATQTYSLSEQYCVRTYCTRKTVSMSILNHNLHNSQEQQFSNTILSHPVFSFGFYTYLLNW